MISCCFCRMLIELLWSIAFSKVSYLRRNWTASKATCSVTASLPTNADVFTPCSLNVKWLSFIKPKYHSWKENLWNSKSITKGPYCLQLLIITQSGKIPVSCSFCCVMRNYIFSSDFRNCSKCSLSCGYHTIMKFKDRIIHKLSQSLYRNSQDLCMLQNIYSH